MPPPDNFIGRRLMKAEQELKQRYTERRRASQPSYTPGPKSDPHFEKAAEKVVSLNASATNFIDAQFEMWGAEGCPQPTNLHCPAATKRYHEFVEEERCPPVLEWKNQKFYLTNYLKRVEMTVDEALLASWTNFRSWFRVLHCSDEALPEAKRKFGKTAFAQVNGDTALLKYLQTNHGTRIQRLVQPAVPGEDDSAPAEVPPPSQLSGCWENHPGGLQPSHSSGDP